MSRQAHPLVVDDASRGRSARLPENLSRSATSGRVTRSSNNFRSMLRICAVGRRRGRAVYLVQNVQLWFMLCGCESP